VGRSSLQFKETSRYGFICPQPPGVLSRSRKPQRLCRLRKHFALVPIPGRIFHVLRCGAAARFICPHFDGEN
jgi:hypothetical protein